MDSPAMKLLFGSDIGILSVITVGLALLIMVVLIGMFIVKSGRKGQ